MKFFRNSLALLVLCAALVGHMATPASAAGSALDFRVAPAAGSQLSEGGDYFVLDMEPGESRTQSIEITNPSKSALQVQLAGVDAATAQMGGVDYAAEELSARAVGGWISLKNELISLAPGESKEADFKVAVPRDAATGVHLGGLVIWVEGAEKETAAGARTTMSVQSRRVIAVQVELPGPAAPLLEIRGAQAEARPDGLYLGIDLFNPGTDLVTGTGTVSIEGRDEIGSFVLDTMVPRTGTNFPFRWDGAAVPNGSYEVAIEIDYGVGIATWQGPVSVGPALQEDLRGRGIKGANGSPVPWLPVAVGAGLALVVMLLAFPRTRSLLLGSAARLPRVSISRAPRVATPVRRTALQKPRPGTPRPAVFVPRSEEEQRCVPPPPPPPPPGGPIPASAASAGIDA